jgi:mannose-1-phosphate guanylyltransferase
MPRYAFRRKAPSEPLVKALVLIGGRGTRLRPLTLSTPKPLLPLANKPFLRYQLEVLRGHVDEVILCAADPKPFKDELGSSVGGVKLRYLSETQPLGTGGAVRNAAAELSREREFLVLNGDVLNNLAVRAFLKAHRDARALATISLTRVADPSMYGLVETAKGGRIARFIEKPSPEEAVGNTVNAGAYIFDRRMLEHIVPGKAVSLEREVFPALIGRGLHAWESSGYWIDIGTLDRYLQVHLDLLAGRTGLPLPKATRASLDGGRVAVGEGARVDPSARFSGNVSLGPRCRVDAGAMLRDCVVLEGARIGPNARVERCVVGPRCTVGERASLMRATALAGGSRVEAYSSL